MSMLPNRLDLLSVAELDNLRFKVEGWSHYLGREADLQRLEEELSTRVPLPTTSQWFQGRPGLRSVG